jgi:prepilin-type N-terminal cleavage/methylation domain-containing protein
VSGARAHDAPRRSRRGFTIVEVVLAMAVLLIGMTAILGLLSFGAALARTAALRTSAAAAIDAVVADLEATLFPMESDGSAGEPQEIEGRSVPGHPGIVYSAVATPHPDELGLPGGPVEYRVDVDVSWNTAGSTRRRSFTTLLLREIPFGERMRLQFVDGRTGPENPESGAGRTTAAENER